MSSMQPISTKRSPWVGSSPVVSVPKTISRIEFRKPDFRRLGRRRVRAGCESPWSTRHISDASQNFTNLSAGMIEILRTVHDEIGAPALFRIGHLLIEKRRELVLGHAGPPEGALALDLGRGRDHDHRVAAALRR